MSSSMLNRYHLPKFRVSLSKYPLLFWQKYGFGDLFLFLNLCLCMYACVRILGTRVMGKCHPVCRMLRIILWSFGRASSASVWLLEFFFKKIVGKMKMQRKVIFSVPVIRLSTTKKHSHYFVKSPLLRLPCL